MVETVAPTPRPQTMTVSKPVMGMPAPPADDVLHELRVRIPVDLHRQLLSLKILRGKSLAETVSVALDIYFSENARPGEAAPTAEAASS